MLKGRVDGARWVASAFSDAKGKFRKLRGYRDVKILLAAVDAHAEKVAPSKPDNEKQVAA